MAIYYQVRNSPNRRMKPADKILELTKQINGIINTERYLKDDPVAQPDPDIINASDVSLSFFQEGISEAWGSELRAEYLRELPRERDNLTALIVALKQLEIDFEAGEFDGDLDKLARVMKETGLSKYLWRSEP